jgi:hypothetical protein
MNMPDSKYPPHPDESATRPSTKNPGRPWGEAGPFVLLFFLFAALITWPLMTVAQGGGSIFSLYVYLFLTWSVVIGVLFGIGHYRRKTMDSGAPYGTEEP